MNLLSKGTTNHKTVKNILRTFIMYLSPYRQNDKGVNVCPQASFGCVAACLFTAGMGVFSNVIRARTRRTNLYVNDRDTFCKLLLSELEQISKSSVRRKIKTAIRLNGTSDLDFVAIVKNRTGKDILSLPNLVFYDYTKIIGKAIKYKDTANYTVTFSRSESNESECLEVLRQGINVSAVFDHKKPLPKVWHGYKVLDGDKHDDLMMSNRGVVFGLIAKGKAKTDQTGFVIR
jgi:hypothetical protein